MESLNLATEQLIVGCIAVALMLILFWLSFDFKKKEEE